MLDETLSWRAYFKPEDIRWVSFFFCTSLISFFYTKGNKKHPNVFTYHMQKDVAEEGETGKVYRADFFDKQGRTVLVLAPAKQVRDFIYIQNCVCVCVSLYIHIYSNKINKALQAKHSVMLQWKHLTLQMPTREILFVDGYKHGVDCQYCIIALYIVYACEKFK